MAMMKQAAAAAEDMPQDETTGAEQGVAPEQPAPKQPQEGGEPMGNVTPEEQAEYDRAAQALATMLYSNKEVAKGVSDQLQEEEKVGSAAKAAVMLIKVLDDKIQLDEAVIAEITKDATSEVIEIGESKGMQYSDVEKRQILGVTWESVLSIFGEGTDLNEAMRTLTDGMDESQVSEAQAMGQQIYDSGEVQEGSDMDAEGPPPPQQQTAAGGPQWPARSGAP